MIWLSLYIGSIVAANVTLALVGLIPVGFGLMAPAGVLWAGVALTLRDFVHDSLGRIWVIGAIGIGAALSWWLSTPAFDPGGGPSAAPFPLAIASGTAFLVSELADMAVYSPLRRRHWLGAIALSNTVGLIVDSALFLYLAFGSLDFLAGQIVGKAYMTVAAVAVLGFVRQRREAVRCS